MITRSINGNSYAGHQITSKEDVLNLYKDAFQARPMNGDLLMGPETEVQLADGRTGISVYPSGIRQVISKIAELDRSWTQTDDFVLERMKGGWKQTIGTDMGALEFSTPPTTSRSAALANVVEVLDIIKEAARPFGWVILEYGQQPFTNPSQSTIIPKGRYFALGAFVGPEMCKDSITAAAQIHFQPQDVKEAIMMLAILNGAAPAETAMCGNAAVYNGEPSGYLDLRRSLFADLMIRIDPVRVSVFPRVSDIEEFVDVILKTKFIMTKVPGEGHELAEGYKVVSGSPTLENFIQNGGTMYPIKAIRNGSYRYEIDKQAGYNVEALTSEDVLSHSRTIWNSARLNLTYGTVEWRQPSFQCDQGLEATYAFAQGLLLNPQDALSRVSVYTVQQLRQAEQDAIKVGMNATIGGLPIRYYAEDLVAISEQGLRNARQDPGPLEYFKPSLRKSTNPAEMSLEIFIDKGKDEFLRAISR